MATADDFAPYREQLASCYCQPCREVQYAASKAGQLGLRDAMNSLLATLAAGTHTKVDQDTYHQQCKEEREQRIAQACQDGRSEEHLANLHRGYATVKMSDFYATGMGLGMTPGRHEAAMAARDAIREAGRVSRELRVQQLITQDHRNACTYFRVSGQMCRHHLAEEQALERAAMAIEAEQRLARATAPEEFSKIVKGMTP